MRFPTAPALVLILGAALTSVARADVITTTTFESASIPAQGYLNNADPGFTVDGDFFSNKYDPTFSTWSGWALSNKVDVVDPNAPDYNYQYSTITGGGADGSKNFAVAYQSAFDPAPFINLATGRSVVSMDVTNVTYAYLSMKNGDAFSKKFGPDDFLTLHVKGFGGQNGGGAAVGQVDFNLAANGVIVNAWQTIDLSSLAAARSLVFTFSSSDVGPYGINTPTYVAIDDFKTSSPSGPAAVPEPASLATAAVGLAVVAIAARRERRRAAV